ncbi:MAG: indole-3-glycerol-phosphate synthase [Pseudomonadota bacterium]|nr:indole-3-glycerol-phosphate synthase [Pseudomonadota bacterium]
MAKLSQSRYERDVALVSASQQEILLADLDSPKPLLINEKGFDIIAEIKRKSPAEGKISTEGLSLSDQAKDYITGGAIAVSVLTEPDYFGGSFDDLSGIAFNSNSLPVMCKDFLVSPYQIRQARLAGASGVLLIAGILNSAELEQMFCAANDLDMFVLFEVFDQDDLEKILSLLEKIGNATEERLCRYLIGVNCRNLRDLEVNFSHFETMLAKLPNNVPWVAESGLKTILQAEQLAQWGYRLALAGTTLMKSNNPSRMVADLAAAGRAKCL